MMTIGSTREQVPAPDTYTEKRIDTNERTGQKEHHFMQRPYKNTVYTKPPPGKQLIPASLPAADGQSPDLIHILAKHRVNNYSHKKSNNQQTYKTGAHTSLASPLAAVANPLAEYDPFERNIMHELNPILLGPAETRAKQRAARRAM